MEPTLFGLLTIFGVVALLAALLGFRRSAGLTPSIAAVSLVVSVVCFAAAFLL